MAEKEKSIIPGALLVLIGVFLLLQQLGVLNLRFRHFFPIAMLGLSALFFISLLNKKDKGAVFPATVLLVLGLYFLVRNFEFQIGGHYLDEFIFWPIFLIAFGLAFVMLYILKREDWGLLIPGGVMLFLGVMFFLRSFGYYFWWEFSDFWPVILIVIGLSIVIRSLRKKTE